MDIKFNNADDGHDIARAAQSWFTPGVDQCIARHKDDQLIGGVIYTNYTGESMVVHIAAFDAHWINRDMLYVCFDYPFKQLGVKRLFGQTPESNFHSLEFNRKLGFKVVTRIEGVYRHNVACIVTKMEADECRFLGLKPRGIKSNLS